MTGNILHLIAWRGYDDPEAAAPFLEDSGLQLEVEYVDADEQAVEILKAGVGAFDAVVLDDRYLPLLVEADLLAPLDESRLPNGSDCLEPFALLRRKAPGGGVWSVPFIWGTHPMAYNARFVERPPASWLDVLEPKYEGKVAMLDGAIHQLIVWGRVLGYPDPTRITRPELAAAVELAVRVKRQCRARLVGWDELPAVLASGEAWIATAGWEAVTPLAAALGADVRLSHTREGAYPWMDSWCIPRQASNEDAAYAWIDWMLGPEAQVVLARNLPCGSVNRRAARLLEPEAREVFPYEEVGRLFASPSYVGMPPLAAAGDVATRADWYEAWDEVRAA